MYCDDWSDRYLWANVRYEVRKDTGPNFKPKGYLPDYLAEEAANAITINKHNPFFMYVAFTSMHTPFQAYRPDYDAVNALERKIGYVAGQPRMTHCEKVYAAMLMALDRAIGTILTSLQENGLSENTIVMFTNDNGAPMYMHNLNTPFRGGKATLFEGGLHVPLLVKWPRLSRQYDHATPPRAPSVDDTNEKSSSSVGDVGIGFEKLRAGNDMGIVIDSLVGHIDIFPTVLEAAGVPVPYADSSIVDGKSLIPLLTAAASGRKSISGTSDGGHVDMFWRSGQYMAYRRGNWKVQSAMRPMKVWLYNLDEDPAEKMNLAEIPAYRGILEEMVSLMMAENATQSPPIWPALSETPVLIDKLFPGHYVRGDEYIYWSN